MTQKRNLTPSTSKHDPLLRPLLFIVAIGVLAAGIAWPRLFSKENVQTDVLSVPGMKDDVAVRIATNAALHQITGILEDDHAILHGCEISLSRRVVTYHEGRRLRQTDYRTRIQAAIQEEGYASQIVALHHNPLPPVIVPDRVYPSPWQDRHTAILFIPDMTGIQDANRVADAIAFARAGGDIVEVVPDSTARTIELTYDRFKLTRRNLEAAIAGVGVGTEPQNYPTGSENAVARGWRSLQEGFPFALFLCQLF